MIAGEVVKTFGSNSTLLANVWLDMIIF